MATKSAGIPSDTASSASPRYRRTFGASSTSSSSRQSRIASAISVGVISSSPASSATELTSAMAFRIRSAAAPRTAAPPSSGIPQPPYAGPPPPRALAPCRRPRVLQRPFDQPLRRLGFAVGRCLCHPKRGCALVHDRDFDDRLLRRFAEDLDVDVAPALLGLDQRRVDGLVQSSAAAFSGFHVRSLLAVHLLGFLCLFEPPGGPVLATLGAALFPMFGAALLGSAGAPPATVLNRAGSTLPHPTTKLC